MNSLKKLELEYEGIYKTISQYTSEGNIMNFLCGLKAQLKTKDIQIANLQQIIYNRDTKLIEHKKWWQFWK